MDETWPAQTRRLDGVGGAQTRRVDGIRVRRHADSTGQTVIERAVDGWGYPDTPGIDDPTDLLVLDAGGAQSR